MFICPKCHFRNGESSILCADCGEILEAGSPGTVVEAPVTIKPLGWQAMEPLEESRPSSFPADEFVTMKPGHGVGAAPPTLQPNELRGAVTLKPEEHLQARAEAASALRRKVDAPVADEADIRTPTAPPSRLAAVAEAVTVSPTPQLRPILVVLRGERVNTQYPIYPGENFVGRTDDKPVDIDLENQEPAERIWTSRQHAVIQFENGALTIQDLNSLNGTFVNRSRVHPGQVRQLQANDIIQIGTVQLRVVLGS